MKKLSFLLPLIFLLLVSCKSENEYTVGCMFPELSTNGVGAKFTIKYMVWKYKIPVPPDVILSVSDELQKEVFGGVGISGALRINSDNIEFIPDIGSSLIIKGVKSIIIPSSDIVEVRKETRAYLYKMVVVTTINGTINFLTYKPKNPFLFYKFYDEEIYDKINALVKKNNIQ